MTLLATALERGSRLRTRWQAGLSHTAGSPSCARWERGRILTSDSAHKSEKSKGKDRPVPGDLSTAPANRAPVEVLRAAARAYADAVTLARAAAEIGMTVSGLHSFLGGTNPHPGTLRKLNAWYLRRAQAEPDRITAETVEAALAVLVAPLPPRLQPRARVTLLSQLEELLADARVPPPPWLTGAIGEHAED